MTDSMFHSKKVPPGCKTTLPAAESGFTLIELLVVIAIIAILASILLPALANAKTKALRAQCMSQEKQLATGFDLFANDNSDTYPPAAYAYNGGPNGGGQLSWDSWIYPYIGGSAASSADQFSNGTYMFNPTQATASGLAIGLKIFACPADTFTKVSWMMANGNPQYANRTYAMNACGSAQGATGLVQRDPRNGLPPINTSGFHGVGIYWSDSTGTAPDMNAKGFQTTVVKDPAGTILLCELSCSQNCEGNAWCSCACGPWYSGGGWGDMYQIDASAPTDVKTLSGFNSYNEGGLLYLAQNKRFNYAFHDGHVEPLQYENTIGSAKGGILAIRLQQPAGMWTVAVGD